MKSALVSITLIFVSVAAVAIILACAHLILSGACVR